MRPPSGGRHATGAEGELRVRIREQTIIDRPASAVWRFVATAESFRAWNGRIVGP